LCGKEEPRYLFTTKVHDITKCEFCGVAQTSCAPDAEELAALYGGGYFAHKKYQLDFGAKREMSRRMTLLARLRIPPGAAVLDAGCATADFVCVSKNKYKMYGSDVSKAAIDVARERNPELASRIYASNLCDMPIAPGSLDAVVLWDVLEHFSDPLMQLKFITRLLRPGGVLLLSTPDMGSANARLMGRRWAFMTPPEHQFFFNSKSIAYLFGECGLTGVYARSLGKWTSLGFVAYKIGRLVKESPRGVLSRIRDARVGKLPVYVPTGDIMYVGAVKPHYNIR
jgi:2-polyprenyl-3-methyl-5-hydroxy-6-metoxy-1,4-benzoquinol methylase